MNIIKESGGRKTKIIPACVRVSVCVSRAREREKREVETDRNEGKGKGRKKVRNVINVTVNRISKRIGSLARVLDEDATRFIAEIQHTIWILQFFREKNGG